MVKAQNYFIMWSEKSLNFLLIYQKSQLYTSTTQGKSNISCRCLRARPKLLEYLPKVCSMVCLLSVGSTTLQLLPNYSIMDLISLFGIDFQICLSCSKQFLTSNSSLFLLCTLYNLLLFCIELGFAFQFGFPHLFCFSFA